MNAKRARALISIEASSARMDKGVREAQRKLRAMEREEAARKKRTLQRDKKMRGVLGAVGGTAMKSLAIGFGVLGAAGIAEAAGDIRDFERNLVRFQLAAGRSPAQLAEMRQQIQGISRQTAVASADILAGAQTYVDLTGDVAGAQAAMSSFARIAQASGSSVSDIATATAALQQAMKLDSSQIEAAFSGLIVQGKKGAVSLKDFAGELSTLAPQFAQFQGGAGLAGIREMGSAFQVIRQGAGSAGEAATQFQALMGELVASHKELAAVGVKVFDPKTNKLNNFSDVMTQIAQNKLLKDPRRIVKIFGRKEAQMAVRTIQTQIGAMKDLARAAEDTGAVQRDMNNFLQTDAGKIDQAFNNMKLAIAEAFTPERIAQFTQALVKVGEWLAKIVGYIDKAVQYADKIRKKVMGPSVDERVESMYQGVTSNRKKFEKMYGPQTREHKLALANKYEQEAAALYHKKGGMNETDQVNFEVNQKLASDLRRDADAWRSEGKGFDQEAFKSRYAMAAQDRFEKYDLQYVEPIAQAIRDGFATVTGQAGGAAPVVIQLDGARVGKGVDNSPRHRAARRP